jgi:hypothetical protein
MDVKERGHTRGWRWQIIVQTFLRKRVGCSLGVGGFNYTLHGEDLVLQPFDSDLVLLFDAGEFPIEKVDCFCLGDIETGGDDASMGREAVELVVGVYSVFE